MKTNLAITYPPSSWCLHSWKHFADMTDKGNRVAVVPVVSISAWGLDTPLDTEESLTLRLLNEALQGLGDPAQFLVIPPMRFNIGGKDDTFFRTDVDTAHQVLAEVAASIQAAGFSKLLFFNSSPGNENLVDAAGRDLRIALGMQPFCINLSSLGLEWASSEGKAQCLELLGLLGNKLETPSPALAPILTRLRGLLTEVHTFRPLPDNGRIPFKNKA